MDKKNIVIGGGNVSGNIGSCSIQSTDVPLSSWSYQTIAVNSCTGEIVASNTYTSYGNIFAGAFGTVIIALIIVFIFVGIFGQ